MTEKTKQRLTVASLIVLALVAIYLLLKNSPAAAASTGTPVDIGGNNYGAPAGLGSTTPGGLSFNVGGITIPGMGGVTIPSVTIPGSGSQGCCASCGCDEQNGVNSFAQSTVAALNSYAQSMAGLMSSYSSNLFGSIPDFVSQYIATADPQAPGGLNG